MLLCFWIPLSDFLGLTLRRKYISPCLLNMRCSAVFDFLRGRQKVNRLGLPVTEAEARLLVVEYGGAAGGACPGGGGDEQTSGRGDGQLSLDDFDFMVRRQSRATICGPP